MKIFKLSPPELIFLIFSGVFSSWLMFSTFSYKNGSMLIATKAWSDFASHIPLIRSFSYGVNFPPQYPLFPGYAINYHFLFFFFVGMLERMGLRIDWALNSLSAVGFFALLLMIYLFAKKLFSSQAVGFLSVLFFLFNGSFSFIYFPLDHPLTANLQLDLLQIIHNQKFPSFGPYDNRIVSAFWNLNIYTNQRHLAAALAISLFIIYLYIKPLIEKKTLTNKTSLLLGLLLGLTFYFHLAIFLMTIIVIGSITLLNPKLIKPAVLLLGTAALLSFPQYLYLKSAGSNFTLILHPGYLIADNLNLSNFWSYWFFNLGFHLLLIPVTFVIANKLQKQVLLSFFLLFIIGNLFQFSPEMAADHKFFNYFMIIGGMFSAYLLIQLWLKSPVFRPIVILLIFSLILSGIIDFFPIFNDTKVALADYPINPDVQWIMTNTPPNTVFLNSAFLYDAPSIAGRKIFLGWPYFAWSAGYNTNLRFQQMEAILQSKDPSQICSFLQAYHLDYIAIHNVEENDFNFNPAFWINHFTPIYKNSNSQLYIYQTTDICQST